MPIRFKCPTCERILSIARRKAGTQVVCPRCEDDVTVPEADLAHDEDLNAEPAEDARSEVVPVAIGAEVSTEIGASPVAQATAKPRQDRLFEQSDFEQLLDEKVKVAGDESAVKKSDPTSPPLEATPPVELPFDRGFTLSYGAATILSALMLVLLALAFSTGYLIGR